MNNKTNDIKKYANYLEKWLEKQVKKSHSDGVVFGLSGGVDSAVVAGIAKSVFPQNHIAITMHLNNSTLDLKCTKEIVEKFKLNVKELNLNEVLFNHINALRLDLNSDLKIIGNLKSRLRMISLYALAQQHNYIVCGTSNYDEWMTGYFTKYGDSACDISLLRNCLKNDVYALAKHYLVPNIIINRKPTASLFPNQTDEDDLKLKYNELDFYWLNKKVLSKSKEKHLKELIKNSNHKRKLPPAPKSFKKWESTQSDGLTTY
ncbi:NAD(+) synthase [Mycoplasmoides alvi]|uniref:NAD(+) synthase n=1 Tax=Mycoplasmoides alvi TaxID=78580 RepID=UPI00051B1456|nr:NAD(+) synthase [Mycoplasmoides alvi]